jgi:hypothetical protein
MTHPSNRTKGTALVLFTVVALAWFSTATPAQQAPAAPQAGAPAAGRGGAPAQPGGSQDPAAGAGRRGGGPGGGNAFPGVTPLNVLVVSGGCCHDYPGQDRILYDILNKVAPIHWTFSLGMTNIPDGRLPLYSQPNYGATYDLIVHNECWANGDFSHKFLQDVVAPHLRGVPSMVFHCSLHSYRAAPDGEDAWREMLGVTSHRHTRAHPLAVRWSEDPITKGLEAVTTPVDELYVIEKVWPGTTALATVVNDVDQGISGAAGSISNDVYPVAWKHEYAVEKGGARVFGTSLGHANESWNLPQFQEMVIRGFRWVMRKDPLIGWTATVPAAGGRQGGAGAPAPGGSAAGR